MQFDAPHAERLDRASLLTARLRDERGWKVAFLAHCLLNQNTRYLGGACRSCCVREIVQECMDQGIGIVQMPCPEERAWGGVLKRRLLRLYGTALKRGLGRNGARLLGRMALWFTDIAYRRIARETAKQMEDYVASGFQVIAAVGIDGSPSCGVTTTLPIPDAIEAVSKLDPHEMDVRKQNHMVMSLARPGRGLFFSALRRELDSRRLQIPVVGHDLFAELRGSRSNISIAALNEGRDRARSSNTDG
jgi:predicted secreted protein